MPSPHDPGDASSTPSLEEISRRLASVEEKVDSLLAALAARGLLAQDEPGLPGTDASEPASPEPEVWVETSTPAMTADFAAPADAAIVDTTLSDLSAEQVTPDDREPDVEAPSTTWSPSKVWGADAHEDPAEPVAEAPPRAQGLEQLIGGRVFAATGALVVIAGLGFAIRLAWNAGWLRLSDSGKCLAAAGVGVALLAAGEVVRRRFGGRSAAAVFAAGVGTLYTAAWASYGLYHLVPSGVSLSLLALVSLAGLAVAIHAKLLSVASLALLGAYCAPVLVRSESPPAWALPLYLAPVTALGLVLSAWNARYRPLRIVCWWPVMILSTLWMFTTGHGAPGVALVFALGVWAAFHAELLITTLRGGRAVSSGPEISRPIVSSLSTTAWAALWAGIAFDGLYTGLDWMGPAVLAAASLGIAFVLCERSWLLTRSPKYDAERLGVSLLIQTGALVLASIAWGVSGWMQGVAGLALAVAAVVMGRSIRSPGLVVYGFIALTLATLRVFLHDHALAEAPDAAVLHLGGFVLSGWSALVGVTALAWVVLRWVTREQSDAYSRAPSAILTGVVVACFSSIVWHSGTQHVWLAMWIAGVGVASATINGLRGRHGDEWVGDGALALACLGVVGVFLQRVDAPGYFGFHASPGAVGLLMLGVLVYARAEIRLRRFEPEARESPAVFAALAFALVTGAMLYPDISAVRGARVLGVASLAAFMLWPLRPRLRLDVPAMLLSFFAASAWGLAYVNTDWIESESTTLLHPGFVHAMALVALWALVSVMPRIAPTRFRWTEGWMGASFLVGSVVLALLASSIEVSRVAKMLSAEQAIERGVLSIWWGVFGIGLLVAGSRDRSTVARRAGLALLGIATLKTVIWDLASVGDAIRVASFIVLGILLLGVSAFYLKSTSAKKRSHERDRADSPPPA